MKPNFWTSYSIYIPKTTWYLFLSKFIRTHLQTKQLNSTISTIYLNLNSFRGENIVIFVEFKNYSEYEKRLVDRLIKDWQVASGIEIVNAELAQSEITLFRNIAPGSICRGLVKLKAEPFLYFSSSECTFYYKILNLISKYLTEINQSQFEQIINNKFIFCFNLIISTLNVLPLDNTLLVTLLEENLEVELIEAESKLGKNFRYPFFVSYEKNRNTLKTNVEGIMHNLPNRNELFVDNLFQALITNVIKTTKATIRNNKIVITAIFVKSLLADIYNVFDFDKTLQCTFFITNSLKEYASTI